jgi:hypothetical protein
MKIYINTKGKNSGCYGKKYKKTKEQCELNGKVHSNPIKINDKYYKSKQQCIDELHIAFKTLKKWIKQGKAIEIKNE